MPTTMSYEKAIEMFGSHLSVQVGEYTSVTQALESFEEARKSHVVIEEGEDPSKAILDWIFPDTAEGMAAAKQWAYDQRAMRQVEDITRREATLGLFRTKFQIAKAKLFRDKDFLAKVGEYQDKLDNVVVENFGDDEDNIRVNILKEELVLGEVLPIGTKIYMLKTDFGAELSGTGKLIDIVEHEVTSYAIYTHQSDGFDLLVHAYYKEVGSDREYANGHISAEEIEPSILEFKSNAYGDRLFRNRSDAVEAGWAILADMTARIANSSIG